jgi:hypothetical protein
LDIYSLGTYCFGSYYPPAGLVVNSAGHGPAGANDDKYDKDKDSEFSLLGRLHYEVRGSKTTAIAVEFCTYRAPWPTPPEENFVHASDMALRRYDYWYIVAEGGRRISVYEYYLNRPIFECSTMEEAGTLIEAHNDKIDRQRGIDGEPRDEIG